MLRSDDLTDGQDLHAQVTKHPEPDSSVLSRGNYKIALLLLFAVMTSAVSVPTFSSGPTNRHVFYGVMLLLFVVFDVRWLRARVAIDPRGMPLRSLFRTYTLAWNQIVSAEAVSSSVINRVTLLQVSIADGRTVTVDGVGEWSKASSATTVQRAAALINTYGRGH